MLLGTTGFVLCGQAGFPTCIYRPSRTKNASFSGWFSGTLWLL